MRPETEKWLEEALPRTIAGRENKFRIGNAKHHNNFLNLSLLELIDEALQENYDQGWLMERAREVIIEQQKIINGLKEKVGIENKELITEEVALGESPIAED